MAQAKKPDETKIEPVVDKTTTPVEGAEPVEVKPEEAKEPVEDTVAAPADEPEATPVKEPEPYTADIREVPVFKEEFTEADLEAFLDEYKERNQNVVELYVTDPQAEVINEWAKKLKVEQYKGIRLVIA